MHSCRKDTIILIKSCPRRSMHVADAVPTVSVRQAQALLKPSVQTWAEAFRLRNYIVPGTGKLLFRFTALPQLSCVWPWASYCNPSGLESPSCKLEIILLHPLWLCLYILQALWGMVSCFLFVWQTVLSPVWSWLWLCHLDSIAIKYIFSLYPENDKKSLWVGFTLE